MQRMGLGGYKGESGFISAKKTEWLRRKPSS